MIDRRAGQIPSWPWRSTTSAHVKAWPRTSGPLSPYTLRKYGAGGADLAPPGRTCYADADVPIDGYLPRRVDQVSVPVRE
jgi:hypothetical protein